MKVLGQGKPLFILHGWGGKGESWLKTAEYLKNNFQIILIDLPGFGKTEFPKKAWNLDDYCQLVLALIKEFAFEKITLLGHSFGGRIAIKIAAEHPDKLEKLILVSAAGLRHKFNLKTMLAGAVVSTYKLFPFFPRTYRLKRFFYEKLLRRRDYFKAEGIMKEIFKNTIEEDLLPLLSLIEVKTLIIWGKKDKITPIKDAYLMQKKIAGSILKTLPSRHLPHKEVPRLLAQEILDQENGNSTN